MRRALHRPSGQQYLAEQIPEGWSRLPRGDWRCPNPACGEPCTHVPATEQHRAFFKHVPGVADMESCFYFAEETPTQRQHDCIDLLERDLVRRYGRDKIHPEVWVDGISYPLDLLVERPDGGRWGFWYVSPRRASMTLNLLKQAAAAGVQVSIFTHVEARKPAELFRAREQQAFLLDPNIGQLLQSIDHRQVAGPIERWEFSPEGALIPPPEPASPPVQVPRPAAKDAPSQPSFLIDREPEAAPAAPRAAPPPPWIRPAEPTPVNSRARSVWAELDHARLPADLGWIIQASAYEWAPPLLSWFLSKPHPFRISQACQFIAQRWRLHPSLTNQHDLVFLRAMHAFWELVAERGHVRIVVQPEPIHVYPTRPSETG
ncbi:MAG: hypothetical protein ACOY93_07985 [Bacillota bacterium]